MPTAYWQECPKAPQATQNKMWVAKVTSWLFGDGRPWKKRCLWMSL